jgi:hypothetical protein
MQILKLRAAAVDMIIGQFQEGSRFERSPAEVKTRLLERDPGVAAISSMGIFGISACDMSAAQSRAAKYSTTGARIGSDFVPAVAWGRWNKDE